MGMDPRCLMVAEYSDEDLTREVVKKLTEVYDGSYEDYDDDDVTPEATLFGWEYTIGNPTEYWENGLCIYKSLVRWWGDDVLFSDALVSMAQFENRIREISARFGIQPARIYLTPDYS